MSARGWSIGSLPRLRLRVPGVLRPAFDKFEAMSVVERMQFALVASIAVHAFVIFCVGFKPLERIKDAALTSPLEVVLVNARTKSAPAKADLIAQANLDGGGNTDENRRARSPLPVVTQDKAANDASVRAQRVEQLQAEQRQLMTQLKSQSKAASAPPQPQPQVENVPAPTPADNVLQRSLEIARLEAQIDQQTEAYNKRPRRTFIGARTQESRFAQYIEDWRQKVQRIGSLNYPQAARGVYGALLMTVSIRADGSVEKIEINKSSGKPALDDAAMRIVKLASPYGAFPPDISRDTDVLSITRTWFFTRSDQFVAE